MGKFLVRASAFLRKEIIEVLRQPRLILALVFGPFLILLLFGLGYTNQARAVRTLFVVTEQQSPLAVEINENAGTISPQLIYEGMTADLEGARRMLRNGQIDMVVIVPEDAYETIKQNQQAAFEIYHNEIDPAQVAYIQSLGQVYVQEVNRRVLSDVAQEGQSDAATIQTEVSEARRSAAAMKAALQARNVEEARVQQQGMRTNISTLAMAVGASAGLLSGVEQNVSGPGEANGARGVSGLLDRVQSNPSNSGDLEEKEDYSAEIADLDQQEQDLAELETQLAEFRSISPSVLTQPFTSQVYGISQFEFTPMTFFTPGVIVLLLQHITVTVAALSIVRERRTGMMELFRVSPVASGQIMIGKYISYLIFGALIAVVLALLLYYGLNVPMFGSWYNFALVIFLVLFASLGIGFFISLSAGTESQAVQFAMIALLLSVFFSGFILDLRYLAGPVRVVSWLLPSTYGTILLQNIMLRGSALNLTLIGGLTAIGVVMFLISWIMMRRKMAND